jgi:hypothetical protein
MSKPTCYECGVELPTRDDAFTIIDKQDEDRQVCTRCINKYESCDICGEYHLKNELMDGLCLHCYESQNELIEA